MSAPFDTAAVASLTSAGRSAEARREQFLWLALVCLGAGLFVQQFVTLAKVKRALLMRAPGDSVASLAQKAWSVLLDSWRAFLTPGDLILAAVILAAAGYVVWAEVRHGTATALLDRASRSDRALFGLLALAAAVATRGYLTPGQVFMGDSETHLLRSWMFVEHFRKLDTPVWSNAWYGGFPLLEHYGPLYFAVTALLTVAFGDIHLATKLLLWSCHVASVFTMFWYLREVTRRNLAALVGATAFALSFMRLDILLYQGDLQLSVVFALYPLVLVIAERFLGNRMSARRTFVITSAVFAVLILNHQAYAFFAMVLFAIYLIARLAVTRAPIRQRFKILVLFGGTEVAALFMTSFLLGPFLFGMAEHRGMPNSAFPMLIPNPRGLLMVVKLFRWSALGGDGSPLGYIGLSIGMLAAAGAVYAVRRRMPAAAGLAVCAAASLLMARNRAQYNVKNVDFFMIFVCALAAWAPAALSDARPRFAWLERSRARWGDRFPARVAAVCIALMILDLGPTTFQSVFRENYEFKQPMYRKVQALDGPYKVLERQVRTYDDARGAATPFDPTRLGTPSAFAAVQTPVGFFHEGAGLSFGYAVEIAKQTHRDLDQGRLSELSASGLYLLGVKYIVFRDRYHWFTPRLDASPLYAIDNGLLQLTHATPLLFSRRAIGLADVPGYPATDLMRERRYLEPETYDYSGKYFRELVEPLIGAMHLDLKGGVSDVLISRDGDLRGDLGPLGDLRASILGFTTDLKRVTVRYESNLDAIGELPYNFFPYLDVRIDGRPVSFYRSAMNLILVRVPAGEHQVTVRGVMPPLQARLLWLSLAVSIVVVLLPRPLFAPFEQGDA